MSASPVVGGEEHQVGALAPAPDLLAQVQAAAVGEVHVQQGQVKLRGLDVLDRLPVPAGGDDLVPLLREVVGQGAVEEGHRPPPKESYAWSPILSCGKRPLGIVCQAKVAEWLQGLPGKEKTPPSAQGRRERGNEVGLKGTGQPRRGGGGDRGGVGLGHLLPGVGEQELDPVLLVDPGEAGVVVQGQDVGLGVELPEPLQGAPGPRCGWAGSQRVGRR